MIIAEMHIINNLLIIFWIKIDQLTLHITYIQLIIFFFIPYAENSWERASNIKNEILYLQMNVKHVTEYLYILRIASHVGSPILSFNLDDPHRSLPADIGRCQEFDGASFLGGTLLA